MSGSSESKGFQDQCAWSVAWSMNTSMEPNSVCSEASVNASGSVTRESFCKAAYLAGQLVSMPAALLVTAIYPGHFTNANRCSELDKATGFAPLPSTESTSFLMGLVGNHAPRRLAGAAGE